LEVGCILCVQLQYITEYLCKNYMIYFNSCQIHNVVVPNLSNAIANAKALDLFR